MPTGRNSSKSAIGIGTRRPCAHFFFHHARGHDADARAVRHRFLDHLHIVEVQRDVDVHVMLAQEAVDVAANGKVFVEADEVESVQILGAHFGFVRQRMIGRGRHHHLLLAATEAP